MISENIIKHLNTTMALKKTKKEFVSVESPSAQKKLGTKKVEKLSGAEAQDQINVAVRREDIRGTLARLFLIGFFLILLAVIVLAGISEGDKVDNAKETLITVSGILAGPLGFVIGYYFRSKEEEN